MLVITRPHVIINYTQTRRFIYGAYNIVLAHPISAYIFLYVRSRILLHFCEVYVTSSADIVSSEN